jgi:hypothetical protein
MRFTQQSGVASPIDLIPRNYLCWARLAFNGMKVSQSTGSRYGEIELTISEGQPYARKKIFTRVADPDYENNSEGYRSMGMVALTRMLESSGLVDVKDAASYEKYNGKSAEHALMLLDGRHVAIKIKVDVGKDGYGDKNEVGEYLTPNEQSQSCKLFVKLQNNDHGVVLPDATKPRAGGFGAAAPPLAHKPGGFGAAAPEVTPATNPPAEESRGFDPNAAPGFLKAGQAP